MPKLIHCKAFPSCEEGLTFPLKPHTPTQTEVVLTNSTDKYVAFKVRIKTHDTSQKTRYKVSPNMGHILPNQKTTVYIYIEEGNVNDLLQLSNDSNSPVECRDKFLIMGVTMKKEAYEHYVGESEETQKMISGKLFDGKNKKKISKLKYDNNRFESAYWNKPLDEEIERRMARGNDDTNDPSDTQPNSSSSTSSTTSATSATTSTTTTTSSTTSAEQTANNEVTPIAEKTSNTKDSNNESVDAAKKFNFDTKDGKDTNVSEVLPKKKSIKTNGTNHMESKATIDNAQSPSSQDGNATSNKASKNRGITHGGAMPVEYEKMVNDLILLRNKYESLLVASTKFVAQRDKFSEMFHRSRSEVIRYRELAKGARAEVDSTSTDADQQRSVTDASNAAAAAAAAAAHSAGKSSGGVPLVAVILLVVFSFFVGSWMSVGGSLMGDDTTNVADVAGMEM